MSLTRDQWPQVEALFAAAYKQPAGQRLQWLRRKGSAHSADPAVLAEVAALIEANEREAPVPQVALMSRESTEGSLPAGETLGHWRLQRLLGRGGMGEVYLAERADGAYEHQVALKLLKRGVDTDAVLRRFLRERRILGQLSHPNIAHLLDAGAAPDGRPYLVMELIYGKPITEWCSSHNLIVRQTLELMVQVCEAVHAAHRQQVVHRDLKPSNVLVSDDGVVKLLDFGIAKLLGEDEDNLTQTLLGGSPATPQYAAPEQLLGQRVTPASDVFSLGMLLYQLLTGKLPPWRQNALLAAAGARSQRTILRPSMAARSADHWRAPDEAVRRQRARELDGDLDQMVLKAIDREPQRRYASAAQFADDLRRYLDGRPVLARPDSWVYVTRKFLVRNWMPVSAAAAVVIALLVGLAMTLWQARVAYAQGRRAERVKDYLVEIFKAADPDRSKGASMTARELLDEGVRQLQGHLGSEPELQAALYDTLANTYLNLGAADRAVGLARSSADIRRRMLPPGDTRIAESLRTLGKALIDQSDFQGAATVLEEAEHIVESGSGHDGLIAARIEDSRAKALDELGHRDQAVALQRQAYTLFLHLSGPHDPETVQSLQDLAQRLEEAGAYDEAAQRYAQAITAIDASGGEQSVAAGNAHLDYGSLLDRTGHGEDSLREHDRAIAILRKILGNDHPQLADALFSRAIVYLGMRRYTEADADLRETLHINPPDSYRAAQSQRYLGQSLILQGRYAEARPVLLAALQTFRKSGPDDQQYYRALSDFARLQLMTGQASEAESTLRQAIANLERLVGPEGYEVRRPLRLLGETLVTEHRYADALAVLGRTQALEHKLFAANNKPFDTALTSYLLAAALLGLDTAQSRQQAQPLVEEAVASLSRQNSPGPELGRALLVRARLALAREDFKPAHTDLLQAQNQLRHAVPPDPVAAEEVRRLLAHPLAARQATTP